MNDAGVPSSYHEPVLLNEVLASLRLRPGGIYVDGTLGGGGHAGGILAATAPDGILVGIDRDGDALAESGRALAPFGRRAILVKGNYADLRDILAGIGIDRVDGIVLDLGVSSHQLEAAERGFSFSRPAPLDMRMDREAATTARDLVNRSDARELERILRDYARDAVRAHRA
jgi:16S rRNA (cytosine1402-N4)-methyltransferase